MATKSEQAYRKILKLLLHRHFEGNVRFSLRELAKILNMSVVPVSEALRRLQHLGLILCRPRRRMRVRVLSAREFLDVMMVREGLECQAVNLLSRVATPAVLEDLRRRADRIDRAIEGGDLKSLPHLDFEFHVALARASRCPLLAVKIEELALVTLLCAEPDQIDHAIDLGTHGRVVDALGTGNPRRAEQAMRGQLNGLARYLRAGE